MAGGDAGGVIFRIEHIEPQGFSDFLGEDGGRPAHLFSPLLGQTGIFKQSVGLLPDHQHGLGFGALGLGGRSGLLPAVRRSGSGMFTHSLKTLLTNLIFPYYQACFSQFRLFSALPLPGAGTQKRMGSSIWTAYRISLASYMAAIFSDE